MEFRRSKPERRQDRRICASCQLPSGAKRTCARCGKKTKPRIQIVWFVDGKRCRELTYHWREADAAQVLRRKEEDYWRQQELGVEREIGGTLREAFEAFSERTTDYSNNYTKQIYTAVNNLANGVGWDRPVPLISSQDIEQYRADGLATIEATSVRSYMLVLRRLFAFLHQEGWIRRNPTIKVRLPKAKARRDCLRPAEVGLVLDTFWKVAPDIAPIATTLILGGWRKGEIINLRRADADLETRWAYVLDFEGDELTSAWSPKSESSARAVPLHPLVVRALRRVEPVARPDGEILPGSSQSWTSASADGSGTSVADSTPSVATGDHRRPHSSGPSCARSSTKPASSDGSRSTACDGRSPYCSRRPAHRTRSSSRRSATPRKA